jgi:hypothetical protein
MRVEGQQSNVSTNNSPIALHFPDRSVKIKILIEDPIDPSTRGKNTTPYGSNPTVEFRD